MGFANHHESEDCGLQTATVWRAGFKQYPRLNQLRQPLFRENKNRREEAAIFGHVVPVVLDIHACNP